MMVTHVDVLVMRTKFWKPCKFQCTRVIFKDLAVYKGLGADGWQSFLANFLNQKHDRKYVL
jgi:hypothetical protein